MDQHLHTVGELKKSLQKCKDEDLVVIFDGQLKIISKESLPPEVIDLIKEKAQIANSQLKKSP